MDSVSFKDKNLAIEFIEKKFQDHILFHRSPELIDVISNQFKEVEYKAAPAGTFTYMVATSRWVIKNDDLAVIEAILDGLKSAAGANFFMTAVSQDGKILSAAIGLVSALFKVAKSARNKGIILTSRQFEIVYCLKNHPDGLDLDQLYRYLNLNSQNITKPELEDLLKGLGNTYTGDGSKRELVINSNNLYRTAGI